MWRSDRSVWRGWVGLLAGIVLAAGAAAEWAVSPEGPVSVQVLESSAQRVVLHFAFGDFVMDSVEIDGQKYAGLSLPGEAITLEKAAPELPYAARSVIIPDDAEVVVRVLWANYQERFERVRPSKGNLLRSVDPETVPYEFGPQYRSDAFYPGALAALSEPYILRDYRGVAVRVYPFQYNPVRGVLRVYDNVIVEVVPVGPSETNVLIPQIHRKRLTRTFHEIYQGHFLNYETGRYPPLDEDGGMLIICYDQWIPNVQALAVHKNSIGINTTIVGVSTIGNNATAIKNHIMNVYNSSDLAFVLLVGDAAQVTPGTLSGGSSDAYYAKLAGNDDYPEIIVGRFSAENSAQVDTQVLRTIEYEANQATLQPWFWRAVGIGSAEGPGDDGEYDWQHIQNINNQLLAHGYTQADLIRDPGATAAMVSDALNAGRGIVNYCGHGSNTGWSTTGFSNSHVNALLNDDMLPFIFSVACVNGQFSGITCFGEAWLRATHNGEPIGAVGAYMSSVDQYWNPPMEAQDEFNARYVAQTYHSYGALCYAGSCSMMDQYGSQGVAMFNTWIIFGDPSLRIVGTVGPPHGIRVSPGTGLSSSGPVGGPFAPGSVQYTIQNLNESGVIDYQVTKSVPWLTLANAVGSIPAGGSVIVTVSINSQANFLPAGDYTDTLNFINLTNHDGDTTRNVLLTVGAPTMQYSWNLDTNPGWTCEAEWAWGRPTGQGGQYGEPDPTSGYTGLNVYGYNLNGDYPNNMPERHLTSTAINCSQLTRVSLRFWRWLGVESPTYDRAYVRVSNNGTTWTTVWQNPSRMDGGVWEFAQHDISAIADHAATLYLRWTMGPTDSSWRFCGWNIDDIEVWGVAPTEPPFALGDLNCDHAVNAFDIDPFVLALTDPVGYEAAYPNCNLGLADINGDGVVNSFDIDAFVELLTGY